MNYNYLYFLSLLFLFVSPAYPQTDIDITKYDLNIIYPDTNNKLLRVNATIYLNKKNGINDIEFLFSSDSEILEFNSKKGVEFIQINYEFISDDVLKLKLPENFSSDTSIILNIKYNYPVNDSVYTMLYLDRGYRWYPLIIDDIAEVKIKATISNKFTMLSSGNLTDVKQEAEFTSYTWQTNIPVFKIPFVLISDSFYTKKTKKINDKEILFYSTEGDSVSDDNIINEAGGIFQYCESLLGSYHHKQLTFITMPDLSGSAIATGIVIVGSDFIKQYRAGYYNGLHLSVASQWFGSSVYGKFQDKGFWFFSISLPHYLRLSFIEFSKGKDVFSDELSESYKRYLTIAGSNNDTPVLSIDIIDSREKGLIIQGKGVYVIEMLRKKITEEKWNSFLQNLYNNFKGKILAYKDFIKIISEFNFENEFNKMMTTKGPI